MGLKLKNNCYSTLGASVSSAETTIRVQAGHGVRFPVIGSGDWFPLGLQDDAGNIEYCRVTARTGDSMSVVRGQEGSQARAYSAGSLVFVPLSVAAIAALEIGSSPLAVSITNSVVSQ